MAVFGIIGDTRTNVAGSVYYGLFSLQHRGQESAGIVVNDDGVFASYKDSGLVDDVFNSKNLSGLGYGTMAIGHVRYGTLGTKDRVNAEPVVVNHIKGRLALATSGKLSNAAELKRELELEGHIFHTTIDAEVVSCLITKERLTSASIEEAVSKAMEKFSGGLCLLLMSPRKMIAARDRYGLHPICYGQREDGQYVIADETCALDSVGATFIRELEPGEIIVFNGNSVRSIKDNCDKCKESLCIFENSVIYGINGNRGEYWSFSKGSYVENCRFTSTFQHDTINSQI